MGVQVVIINPTPSGITLTATPTQPLCSTDKGSISASATGGTGTITYSDGGAFQPTGAFTGLAAGSYTITAKDANGCTPAQTPTIHPTPTRITSTATPTQPLCSTDKGSISAS